MYPLWADGVGWIIGLLPVFVIFVTALQQFLKAPRNLTFSEKIRTLMKPTPEWGPAGRPCPSMDTTDRYPTSNTYDCVSNTRILLNGIPTEGVHINDNFTNGFHDEMLQL